jgi:hypothetical protein
MLHSLFLVKSFSSYLHKIYTFECMYIEQGIAQSVYQQATGWTAGVRFWAGASFLFLLYNVQTDYGAHPPSCQIDTGAVLAGVKRQRHAADHSPPSDAEVKNDGAKPTLPYTSS